MKIDMYGHAPCSGQDSSDFTEQKQTSPLLQRFFRIAQLHGHQPACIFSEFSLSYEELDKASDALATQLQAHGLGTTKPVGVVLERSPEVIVAFLAAAKAGVPYVPVALEWPERRSRSILQRCNAGLVIAASEKAYNNFCGLSVLPVIITTDNQYEPRPLPTSPAEQLPLYILHTSGSTGQPKGVMVSHANVLHFATNFCHEALRPGARVAFCAALTFDATVLEIWGSLLNGCTIVGGRTSDILDAPRCQNFLSKYNISSLFLATAAFNALALQNPSVFSSLGFLFMGGEKATLEILRSVFAAGPPKKFYHCYGPTETTVIITKDLVNGIPSTKEDLSVGTPIGDAVVRICDEHGIMLPTGETGEVVLGGPTVSMGYLNDVQRTEQVFIPDNDNPGMKLYRTGDLGRLDAQGKLTLLGRFDDQVKISGYRVNLGEICSTIELAPEVATAHVAVRRGAESEPVAYVVVKPDRTFSKESLSTFLSKRLPQYMLPRHFVFLPKMPINANGKVDKGQLPEPSVHMQDESPETVLGLFRLALGSKYFTDTDSFLAHGGTSLKAASLIVSIRKATGATIPLDIFYQKRTIEHVNLYISLLKESQSPAAIPSSNNSYEEVIF
ncbi:non-ribosomal peptide synthetase [Oleidesulfovibrio sp.]|uniref:non-ribosomal peptide synthetase n=1 Tax=Oleidesulfovibrio sp. TaxID=2909707 RepID=UPI003A853ACC